MRAERVNRVSTGALAVLACTALLTIVTVAVGIAVSGQIPPRETEEGTGAHLFQLSIGLMLPVGLVFLSTADWARPAQMVRRLALPTVAAVVAFALLYYFELSLHR